MFELRTEDGIIIAELRNGKYNTITAEGLGQLREIVRKVNSDSSVRGLILTGQGRVFSSGFDLPAFLAHKDHAEVLRFFTELADPAFLELFTCEKPVIAAINGAAVAGGLILALACDYRLAVDNPKIQLGMSEIKIGLGLSPVHVEIMRHSIDDTARLRDVLYNGERYPVQAALAAGLVDELVAEAELLTRAKAIIAKWYDNPGKAFGLMKRSLRGPATARMKGLVAGTDWQEGFRCFFNPETRAALEAVARTMG